MEMYWLIPIGMIFFILCLVIYKQGKEIEIIQHNISDLWASLTYRERK